MSVEYVGPFAGHDVVVEGRLVPYLSATPLPGGRVHLSLDHRFGIELSLQDAERIVPFVAHALAIGLGYTGFPDEGMEPTRAVPMPKANRVDLGPLPDP